MILHLTVGDPYDYWKDTQFSGFDAGSANPLAFDFTDPDKDGLDNLFDFATNSNPLVSASSRKIVEEIKPLNGKFAYTYNRRKGAGTGDTLSGYEIDGVRFVVQTTRDMRTWSSGPAFFELIGDPVDNGDGTESVTVCLKKPIKDEATSFVRVLVLRVAPN